MFIKETRAELAKVTFPSREDVVATTIVVLIASFVFAIFLTLSDVVVNKAYSFVFEILGA
ncbi:MAG: preprotein translocase subunit SecE [Thermoanaerobaculia bacterium]|nr:preprotein translocase subunit SecE [Thermoanaerobaculia bacterium]